MSAKISEVACVNMCVCVCMDMWASIYFQIIGQNQMLQKVF